MGTKIHLRYPGTQTPACRTSNAFSRRYRLTDNKAEVTCAKCKAAYVPTLPKVSQ